MRLSCARHGARSSSSQRQAILIVERDPMWLDRYSAVCQECPNLVAVYESPDGRIALLLRHTLVPLPEEFASLRPTPRPLGAPPPFAASGELHGLQSWYDAMAPSWLSIEPLLRRALVLKTHRWVAEHILIPAADGRTPALEIRATVATLGEALVEMIPPDDRGVWSVWVGLVVGDLERAMRRPSADWNQAWARWLLLIAYSVPIPR